MTQNAQVGTKKFKNDMAIIIPEHGGVDVFAMIVDINGYTKMVSKPEANLIAQFTRDVLSGGIKAVENHGGEVVGFMGDAFFAILSDADEVFRCCAAIAKDIDRQCEYVSSNSDAFPFLPKGPSLKIGIEYGSIELSNISSKFLGNQKLFAGEAINYATRITTADYGNRCLVGPKAFGMGLKNYIQENDGPYEVEGKEGEPMYKYYRLDLSDIWREGDPKESYWG
jgi:class 3 adenylate cyclase